MNRDDFKNRTKKFSIRVIKLTQSFASKRENDIIARQIIRSATSVAANYRAACRARSKQEFIAKLGIVEEEADETMFWLELIIDLGIIKKELLNDIYNEANEILSIVISSKKTARNNK